MEKYAISSLLPIHQTTLFVPKELLIEILLQLPLESILKCKLVSKQWMNIIKDPKFIKLHANKSTILFQHRQKLYCLFVSDLDNNNFFTSRHIPIDKSLACNLLVESSNKIACVKDCNNRFVYYNLFTGDSYDVVDAPLVKFSSAWLCHGFGYDEYEDDYKILVVFRKSYLSLMKRYEGERFDLSCIDQTKRNRNLIFVYSLKARSWSLSSEGFTYAAYQWQYNQNQACSFNGILHWVLAEGYAYDIERHTAATIDLRTCKFAEISLPTEIANSDAYSLSQLDGKLCCCYYMYSFEVWVMKEYGVKESWTKLFNVERARIDEYYPYRWVHSTVLYRCRDGGKLWMFNKLGLVWADIEKDEVGSYDTLWPTESTPKRLKSSTRKAFKRVRDSLYGNR